MRFEEDTPPQASDEGGTVQPPDGDPIAQAAEASAGAETEVLPGQEPQGSLDNDGEGDGTGPGETAIP